MTEEVQGSPTLEEAISQASSSLQTSESSEPSSAQDVSPTPSESPAPADQPTEEGEQVEPEKTPLDEFDPASLPPELQPLYKNLMKGFTQGRQKDREELNQLKQELEALKQPQANQNQFEPELTPEEQVRQLVENTLVTRDVERYRSQALEEYNKIDPRLNNDEANPEYDKTMDQVIGAQMDLELEKYVAEHGNELGFDHTAHAKRLIGEWDGYVQNTRDKYLERQKKLAQANERNAQKTNPRGTAGSSKPAGNMTFEEAAAAALARHK